MPFSHATLTAPKPPPEGYPTEPETVGEHLRKTRMDRGLFQREVADEIGVDPTTIRNWELGHREPRLPYWPAIIEFLGFVPFEVGQSLGEKIVAWRKMNGMPRSELAKRLGVDPSTVWRWEAGETKPHPAVENELKQLLSSLPDREAEKGNE